MRVVFSQRIKGQLEFGVIYGSIAFLALCCARFLPLFSFFPDCTFKAITGIPCPTCGATHSVVHLVHGAVVSAFWSNPLVTVVFSGALLVFLFSLVALLMRFPRLEVAVSRKEGMFLRAGAVILFLAHWAYLVISS
jgi:hypothetical protein